MVGTEWGAVGAIVGALVLVVAVVSLVFTIFLWRAGKADARVQTAIREAADASRHTSHAALRLTRNDYRRNCLMGFARCIGDIEAIMLTAPSPAWHRDRFG